VEGVKFDLRLYVLVLSATPLRILLFKEGLARFCTEPYKVPAESSMEPLTLTPTLTLTLTLTPTPTLTLTLTPNPNQVPTESNMEQTYMHLTNFAINKHSEKFTIDDEGDGGHKRSVSSLMQS